MKGIVGKTGGEVRIMDGENIPGNLEKERDNMEILSAEDEQVEGEEPGVAEEKSHEKQEPTVKTKNKPLLHLCYKGESPVAPSQTLVRP